MKKVNLIIVSVLGILFSIDSLLATEQKPEENPAGNELEKKTYLVRSRRPSPILIPLTNISDGTHSDSPPPPPHPLNPPLYNWSPAQEKKTPSAETPKGTNAG